MALQLLKTTKEFADWGWAIEDKKHAKNRKPKILENFEIFAAKISKTNNFLKFLSRKFREFSENVLLSAVSEGPGENFGNFCRANFENFRDTTQEWVSVFSVQVFFPGAVAWLPPLETSIPPPGCIGVIVQTYSPCCNILGRTNFADILGCQTVILNE